MTIKVRQIRSFFAIAELGGFRRAAEELAISQPALSCHVKELEDELGTVLFRRTTRQVQLTESGQQFLTRMRRILSEFDSTIADLKERGINQQGLVIIACAPSIAANLFPTLYRQFIAENPRVRVQLCDERTEIIEQRVLKAEVDFAIAPYGHGSSDLTFEPLLDDPYFAVVPADHPLSRDREIPLERLCDFPLIAMRPELNMWRSLNEAALKAGVRLRPSFEVFHHDTLIGMVAAGLGVGAMPSQTISMVRHKGISTRLLVDPVVERQLGILRRRGERLTPTAEAFARITRMHLAKVRSRPGLEDVYA
jgi:LysR family transcriptional regulator, carnitine catabolism transcriptional activator